MAKAPALLDVVPRQPADRAWLDEAVRRIQADANRSADTHLISVPVPGLPGIDLYLKDESTHPTGSLKHRLARSLFLYALCNGELHRGTTVIEASSGSTAVSEAYFARMLDLPFVAVMARSTSPEKIALIEREGGRCHLVDDAGEVYDVARRLADELGGHYLDQFTYAERATDWRGNNNIAESVFEQMTRERHPVPTWVVVGAGTGGTCATIGRFVRYRSLATQVCVVDPENSAFLPAFAGDDEGVARACGSRIEGIGRPRVEPSFVPAVVDRMMLVPDVASVAAMRFLAERTGLRAGCSTGTNLYGALRLACEMAERGEEGSIVSLLCDGADRYAGTYLCDDWVAERGWDLQGPTATLRRAWDEGVWDEA
ncbi:PLP-dependent cysteine synthase family protein [Phycicoccus sp. M110.8]|uniref:PLP-dependent cysteine synthase family protein n=1 Tax=Phycicoccus sp. M110.8 TaxID=3075433 RepID=UPI0028FD2BF2|nr:PLP-dependent cysteine synthase family protein [Phycicoccus sp. M110.8]MDU0314642.1 PLP-dependent cysteine synthase family protein [Phycicoccus sp. M110.8]